MSKYPRRTGGGTGDAGAFTHRVRRDRAHRLGAHRVFRTGTATETGVRVMEQTWRWFGPDDAIGLAEIRQTGATGIVTALHHIPYGVVWSPEEIARRRATIEAAAALGLRWSVVESLPIAEPIKQGEGDLGVLFDNYRL